jgi:hypothetical protein
MKHDLFDTWTEQSAYIFGFWLADGCIRLKSNHKNKNIIYKLFNIGNTDKQIMDDICSILQCSYCIIKPQKQHWKISYALEHPSDKLFDFCYNITNTIYKSHGQYSLPNIPPELFHHFVRGFFDGDGSIHYKHYKTRHGKTIIALQTSFTGGKDTNIIQQLRDWFRDNIGLGNKKITNIPYCKLSYNQYDSMLLCQFMYKDATLYMKRKKDIWDSADKAKLENSTKYFSNKV